MYKILIFSSLTVFLLGVLVSAPQTESFAAPSVPLPPDAGNATFEPTTEKIKEAEIQPRVQKTSSEEVGSPTRLSIPSIKLDTRVIEVGLNSDGEMDVPDGKTKDVGWYKYGTTPGEAGSAVIGAHVYAAFSKLSKLKPGNHIYVTTSDGKKLHFVVTKTRLYALKDLKAEEIFTSSDSGKYLNLITCAGTYIKSRETYDHRRVVFAELVE